MLSIVAASQAGKDFRAWCADPGFAAINAHPFTGEFGRQYYPEVFTSNVVDESFAVVAGNEPMLVVLCTSGKAHLDYFGMPLQLFQRWGLDGQTVERVTQAAFAKIDAIISSKNLQRSIVGDSSIDGSLSAVGKECLNRGYVAALKLSANCDLSITEEELRQGIRRRYKTLINWGQRNLRMEFVDATNRNRSLFSRYQEFHRNVAGRSTRPQRSWDVMFDWIAGGRGELLMGFLESGELAAGTIIVDGAHVASYASGVYDRKRFDKPMAHWPLWLGILRSKQRGLQRFDIGDIPFSDAEKKQFDIGYFKRGFASRLSMSVCWTCDVESGHLKSSASLNKVMMSH
jgi:hypothetical protein